MRRGRRRRAQRWHPRRRNVLVRHDVQHCGRRSSAAGDGARGREGGTGVMVRAQNKPQQSPLQRQRRLASPPSLRPLPAAAFSPLCARRFTHCSASDARRGGQRRKENIAQASLLLPLPPALGSFFPCRLAQCTIARIAHDMLPPPDADARRSGPRARRGTISLARLSLSDHFSSRARPLWRQAHTAAAAAAAAAPIAQHSFRRPSRRHKEGPSGKVRQNSSQDPIGI